MKQNLGEKAKAPSVEPLDHTLQLQVLPRQYGGQAELVPAAAAVAARRAGEVQAERDPRRSSLAERPAPADEGRLAAARNATGCAIFSFAA